MASLTHWGRLTHICVGNLTIIGSDNGLSPGRRQAIIWTNAWILLIGPLGTNFSEILIGIQTFSFKKMHLKMSSAKWRLFRLGLNVLNLNELIIGRADEVEGLYTAFTLSVHASVSLSVDWIVFAPQLSFYWRDPFHTWYRYAPLREGLSCIVTFDLDPHFKGHLLMTFL